MISHLFPLADTLPERIPDILIDDLEAQHTDYYKNACHPFHAMNHAALQINFKTLKGGLKFVHPCLEKFFDSYSRSGQSHMSDRHIVVAAIPLHQ